MTDKKIHSLSEELCQVLCGTASDKKVEKVSSMLAEVITEITRDSTRAYKKIVNERVESDPALARKINEDISAERDTLIANLSALR